MMTFLPELALHSSIVVAAGLLAMPLLRGRSAALRHWVLAGTLLCAASLPVVGRVAPDGLTPFDVSFATRALSAPGTRSLIGAGAGAGAHGAAADAAPIPADGTARSIASRFGVLWGAGTVVWLAVLCTGLVRLHRLSRSARPVTSGPWIDAVARLAPRQGVRRPVDVRVLDHPSLLLVWGLWRSTLLVPRLAARWPADRIAAVVEHELAHVRRRDWLSQVAAEIVRALYWFNPLVWLACRRLRAESEMAADDAVLAHGTAAARYAAHILDIARELNSRSSLPAPAIVRRSTLERRVNAMLDASRDRRPLSTAARATAGALLVTLTVVVAGAAAQTFSSITGTIVDPTQGVLPGVTLVLVNEQTGAKYEIKTDRYGRYEFAGLPSGSYALRAALPGFAQFNGRLAVSGQPLQQDVVMVVGTVRETITVDDGPPPSSSAPDPERANRLDALRQQRAAAACPAAPPGGDVPIGGNIRPPMKFRDVRPDYPDALRGTSGHVTLDARIGLTGAVEDVEVASSTHPAFAEAAVSAVRQWEFDATLLNCERVPTPMQVTVNFAARGR